MTQVREQLVCFKDRVCYRLGHYLIIELTEAAFQIESSRVGELGKYFQMSDELSEKQKTNSVHYVLLLTVQYTRIIL